jgi:predicted membrane-bound mannosyltransferase
MRLALFLILSTATFVRVYGLGGPSFWVDEVYSAMVVESFSKMWASDVHPPLYYALLYLWASFSTTDYWLRLLSAVLGVLTVAMTYVVGRIVFNTPAALWAAASRNGLYAAGSSAIVCSACECGKYMYTPADSVSTADGATTAYRFSE